MKSDVSNRQMFFLLYLTLTAYTVITIPKVMAQQAGTGGWLPIMITSVVFSLFVIIIVGLGRLFPGHALFDYSRVIAGKFVSFVLAVFFALYFLFVAVFLNVELTTVLEAEFFPRTPNWATLITGIAVFGCIAYKGINSVARFVEIIGFVYLLTAIVVHIAMLTQGDIKNILPLFQPSKSMTYLEATKEVIVPFLGIEILTVIPFDAMKGKRKTLTAFFSLLFIGLFYVFVVETCIMMLGIKEIQNYNYALIEAIKLVDNPVLERFDILYLTVGFSGLIAGVCAVYLALVEYTCKLLPKMNRKLIVLILGILIFALSLVSHGAENTEQIFDSVIMIAGLAAAFVIPTLLFVIAKVRHLGQKAQ